MGRFRLCQGLRFALANKEYVIEELLDNGFTRLKDCASGQTKKVAEEELVQAYFNGLISFINPLDKKNNHMSQYERVDLGQVTGHLKAKAINRESYVKRVLRIPELTRTRERVQAAIREVSIQEDDKKTPSLATVYRWISYYRASNENIRALIPLKRAVSLKLPQIVHDVISHLVETRYLTTQRLSACKVHDEILHKVEVMKKDGLLPQDFHGPSIDTLYRYINALDEYEVLERRFGKRYANRHYKPVGQGPRPSFPLERVEIDSTPVNVIVLDDANNKIKYRAILTAAICCKTKMICGFHLSLEDCSYLSLMECLLNMVYPKDYVKAKYPSVKNEWKVYGLPTTVVVDNGANFTSNDFADACLQLGINIEYSPPDQPKYKGTIERFFRTITTQLFHTLPGTTFSSATDRKDYKSDKEACIKFTKLDELVHKYIVDIYHKSLHKGINDVPAVLWDKLTADFPPEIPANFEDLNILVGHIEERVIAKSGIEFDGLFYNCLDLARIRNQYRGKKAKLKIDSRDISCIYVFDHEVQKYIPIPAVNQEYTNGLTLYQHKIIKNHAKIEAREHVNMKDLLKSKNDLLEMINNAVQASEVSSGRKIGKFNGVGLSRRATKKNEYSKTNVLLLPHLKRRAETEDLSGWDIGYEKK